MNQASIALSSQNRSQKEKIRIYGVTVSAILMFRAREVVSLLTIAKELAVFMEGVRVSVQIDFSKMNPCRADPLFLFHPVKTASGT